MYPLLCGDFWTALGTRPIPKFQKCTLRRESPKLWRSLENTAGIRERISLFPILFLPSLFGRNSPCFRREGKEKGKRGPIDFRGSRALMLKEWAILSLSHAISQPLFFFSALFTLFAISLTFCPTACCLHLFSLSRFAIVSRPVYRDMWDVEIEDPSFSAWTLVFPSRHPIRL